MQTSATQLWQLDAVETAALIRHGQVSSREAVKSALDRTRAVNPAVNAVVRLLEEEALAAADAADAARARGELLGPLHGVPVTTKINVDQAGLPTDNGVPELKNFIAPVDGPVAANLKRAGAVIIGRTNSPAFAMRGHTDNALHGPTLNPWNPQATPGGSSGGAGVAAASDGRPIATGCSACAPPPGAWPTSTPARQPGARWALSSWRSTARWPARCVTCAWPWK